MTRGSVLGRVGGVLLLPPAAYWLLQATSVGVDEPIPLRTWLALVPVAGIGLVLLGVGILCALGQVSGAITGAVLGLATAIGCGVRLVTTTPREREQIAHYIGGLPSVWWWLVVTVCGAVAGLVLTATPALREDSVPWGGPTAWRSWRWAVVAVCALELASAIDLLQLSMTVPDRLLNAPSTVGLTVLCALWCAGAVAAAALRGPRAVIVSGGLVLVGVVMQLADALRHGVPILGNVWMWMGVLLLLYAVVVVWVLPVLRGWTPRVQREIGSRPTGLLG